MLLSFTHFHIIDFRLVFLVIPRISDVLFIKYLEFPPIKTRKQVEYKFLK